MARSRRIPRLGAALVAVVGLAALVTGCDGKFEGTHLRIAAGFPDGVYHSLSQALARIWHERVGVERPEVLRTKGSPDNLRRLASGEADIAFSAADVAAQPPPGGAGEPLALARLYDDYLHVVVDQDGPIGSLAGLAGMRVSIGAPESGVAFIAERLLQNAGLAGRLELRNLGLEESVEAFKAGEVDAFFWSGGLPTSAISKLAAIRSIRLLDLTDDLPNLSRQYPVYNAASIPASTYQLAGGSVSTLAVPNYLMATAAMPDDLAMALVDALFDAHGELVAVNRAALSIDIHSAIETDPVELHPGAVRYYRENKI